MLYGNHGRFPVTLSMLTALVLAAGCSSSSSGPGTPTAEGPPPVTTTNYNGPGSVWDYTMNSDGTFEVTRRENLASAVDLTVNGTYETTAQGFLLMTVTTAEGTDAPSAGDTAWAVEVPGYALLLHPIGPGADQIIPMVQAGACPTSDVSANWVMVRTRAGADATRADHDYFGTFAYTRDTNTADLPARHSLSDGFPSSGAQQLAGSQCADGIMTVADGVMYLTDNAGAIVHTGAGNPDDSSFIFALPQKSITSIASTDGDYAGVLFDDSSSTGDKIRPVTLTCANGICTGTLVTNVVTGETDVETVTVDLSGTTNDPAQGFITGTINAGGSSGNVACMIDESVLGTTQKMLSCVGQSPGDNMRMFNVIFASQ